MESLTRWVLAHKRIVVIFWLVLTIVGMASAGSASKALKQKFSVPGKEGWVANQQIARDFHGTGGNNSPLLPVVTLPAGNGRLLPGVSGELRSLEARVAQRASRQPHRQLRADQEQHVPLQGRSHDLHPRLPPARSQRIVQQQPRSGESGHRAL